MSSQFLKMMAAQREREILQRQHSHGSSQTSEFGSNMSENDMKSQSEGSSGETPSEYSIPTPDDEHFQPEIDQFYFGMDTNTRIKRLSEDSNADHQSLSLIKPEMLASLTTQYDFDYNRYSMIADPSILQDFEENSDEESEGGEEFDIDFDDDDMYSPIEIATPVSLAMPKEKPAVISIPSPRLSMFSPSGRGSLERTSLESKRLSLQESQWSEEEEQEDNRTMHSPSSQLHAFPQRVSSVPTAIPPRRGSSKITSLKKFIRTTSSQILDVKEDRPESRDSSVHHRVTEPARDFNIGAFITSQPTTRTTPPTPTLTIPARSTSRRHSKDLSSLMTVPSLTPRNPRRNVSTYSAFPATAANNSRRTSIIQ